MAGGRRMRAWLLAAAGVAACTAGARADCTMTPWSASMERDHTITVVQTIRTGGCRISYAGGLNVTYESLTVVRRPRHLRIRPGSNGFSLNVDILNNFKGRDSYTIRLCGRNPLGRGCATLIYDVTVI
jgi:hypothetical protein